jgi:ubiquinone biosynthesis protein COQ9
MEHLNRIQIKKGRPSIEAFVSARLETKADSFSELRELYGHLFFNSETGKGLVPYNTGCLEIGKFNIAVLGKSRREVVSKYEHFKSLLAEE